MISGSELLKESLMFPMLVISILLYLMTQGGQAANFMFMMVRSLQMIMHLPLFQIIFPANVMTTIQILIPAVSFDIMESLLNWEVFEDYGYEAFEVQMHDQIGEKILS